jgi:Tfp pilus assembly protein FimT
MKNEEGITLVELVVTISIIAILVVAVGFSFQGWMGGYNVESQMRSMYMDLMNARARATQRNRVHFVNLSATQYTIYEDTYNATDATNPDGDGILQTGSDSAFLQKSLEPRYPITWSNSGDPAPQIQFNKKGLANSTRYICCNSAANADYNCIEITQSMINIGKLTTKITDGGACSATNCISK